MDPTTVTLGGEVRSRSVFFSIIADDLYEADEEFFTVSIVSVTGGEVDPERDTVTVTIRDETSKGLLCYCPFAFTLPVLNLR